ncbi:iron chaperone [Demequina sp. NBRC 110053]|uniref:iron chaperone n=1 Tax=Demequina sp. NBRC 110053 TaxID=1570342 RepID=UPI001F429AE8|nr:DUF1801 domain-containing protein [Demequina sp. NBRC 110053]
MTGDLASHDDCIAAAPERFQAALRDLRERIAAALPDAEETVAYGMPGYRIGEKTVVGYAAFAKSCGVYLPADAIAQCERELADANLAFSKTGVKFTPSRPIPDDLLARLLEATRATLVA